jgi:hypothetical protein
MERHAYINIEPNNGGIVLNVSDEGLCFHSFDPVPRNGTIRFWFSDHKPPIEANATVAWTDVTQKGGLRFTALPAEAREKIRDWISHPAMGDQESAGPGLRSRALPAFGAYRANKEAAPIGSAPPPVSPEPRVPRPSSGFSRGLATGLLVSAVVVATLLFHSYRREVGEQLIQLGERFAKPGAHTMTVSAAAPTVSSSPSPQMVSSASPALSRPLLLASPPAAPRPEKVRPQSGKLVPPPDKLVPQPSPKPANPQQSKLEPPALTITESTGTSDAPPNAPPLIAAPSILPKAPTISLPITAPTSASAIDSITASNSGKPDPAPKLELPTPPGIHSEGSGGENADSIRELYFEVGKFKNVLQAHDETDKLAQLGFPATAVEKGHLWASSFHVLVGPFGDEERAKATHETLVSSGFKPRPFEKGWRSFTLLSPVTLNGARTPEGDYTVSWESYIGDASVKFIHRNSVVATAEGKWVKRDVKYKRDSYVYRRNIDGSRTLLEIHFGGMRQALVFGKPS